MYKVIPRLLSLTQPHLTLPLAIIPSWNPKDSLGLLSKYLSSWNVALKTLFNALLLFCFSWTGTADRAQLAPSNSKQHWTLWIWMLCLDMFYISFQMCVVCTQSISFTTLINCFSENLIVVVIFPGCWIFQIWTSYSSWRLETLEREEENIAGNASRRERIRHLWDWGKRKW